MREETLLIFRAFLFMAMISCFALQSMSSFKKWISGNSSISESIVSNSIGEPLPAFSICSDPPFNNDHMENDLRIPPTFFLPSFPIELVVNPKAFPANLSQNTNDSNSLYGLWIGSVLAPSLITLSGTFKESDTIVNDDFSRNDSEFSEIKDYKVLNSYWFGKCSSLTLKKAKKAKEKIILGLRAPAKHDHRLTMTLHETPGSRYDLIPGDLLTSRSIPIDYGKITKVGINRKTKLLDVQKDQGACKDYDPMDSQALCKIHKKYLSKLLYQSQESIEGCLRDGYNATRLCLIPQWLTIWNLNKFAHMDQCTTQDEYLCMLSLMNVQMENTLKNECLEPCKKIWLETFTKSIDLPKAFSNWAFVYMYYQHDYTSEMREYLIFDFSSIVAAIGGSLGLFLGFSFLQCGSLILNRTVSFSRQLFEV